MAIKKDGKIWGLLGKASAIAALIWTSIQIYNYIFKVNDFEAEITANHSYYETSPAYKNIFEKYYEYIALPKYLANREILPNKKNVDSLLSVLKKEDIDFSYSERQNFYRQYNIKSFEEDYKSIWSFSIKNTGSKPLEGLALELPFKGYYKLIQSNELSIDSVFSGNISIGELRPSYEIKIICWGEDETYSYKSEEKSRFTHKNGWFGISYPVQVSGFFAWSQRNENIPIFFLCLGLAFLLLLTYSRGLSVGKKREKDVIKLPQIEKDNNDCNDTK